MIENKLKLGEGKGKHLAQDTLKEGGAGEDEEGERKMAVTALVAMIEIWMSDLW